MEEKLAPVRSRLRQWGTNKFTLIILGGAIGSYLRYWLPNVSAPASFGPMVGGAVGSYTRFWVSRWFNSRPWGQAFPYGTLFVNVTGAIILAVAALVILEWSGPEHHDWFLWIGTGFCGGFTTFSTFEWETFKLVRDGSRRRALINALVSILAGFVGVVLAVVLVGLFVESKPAVVAFPYGTLAVNVSGSFVLAVAAVIILERLPPKHQDWYLLIGTGFCGGYTTFSTFEWETFELIREGSPWCALTYVLASVVVGFLGVLLGVMLVSLVFPRKAG